MKAGFILLKQGAESLVAKLETITEEKKFQIKIAQLIIKYCRSKLFLYIVELLSFSLKYLQMTAALSQHKSPYQKKKHHNPTRPTMQEFSDKNPFCANTPLPTAILRLPLAPYCPRSRLSYPIVHRECPPCRDST